MYLSVLGFAIVFATGFRWFRLVYAVALPKNRIGFLASMAIGICFAVAGLWQGAGLVGGIFATLSILLGGFFVFTWSISKQIGGSGKFQPGLPLLAFSAPDHSGNTFDSSTLDGRPVLLKFFRGHW
jgi:cytochrome oxidase Cu insertion factor (SCO1/SenC/PrrC family)